MSRKECAAPDCNSAVSGRGYCAKHYWRLRKYGSIYPDIPTRMTQGTLEQKLMAYSMPVPESGCWVWTRKANHLGYGTVAWDGKLLLAHRASWKVFRGEDPGDLFVLHKCDVPACINPDHLFLGSQKDNIHDCIKKQRNSRGEKHSRKRAGLTEQDVKKIRTSGDNAISLAAQFGIHKRTVYAIKAREYWRHVE